MNKLNILFLMISLSLISVSNNSYAAFPAKRQLSSATIANTSQTANAQTTINKESHFSQKSAEHSSSVFGLFSLLSLILGAVGLLVAFFSGAGFALGLVAVIFGAIGLYMNVDRLYATLGIIFGAVAILVALLI
jgi:hypothetical protein